MLASTLRATRQNQMATQESCRRLREVPLLHYLDSTPVMVERVRAGEGMEMQSHSTPSESSILILVRANQILRLLTLLVHRSMVARTTGTLSTKDFGGRIGTITKGRLTMDAPRILRAETSTARSSQFLLVAYRTRNACAALGEDPLLWDVPYESDAFGLSRRLLWRYPACIPCPRPVAKCRVARQLLMSRRSMWPCEDTGSWIFLLQPCNKPFTRTPSDHPPSSPMTDTPAFLAAPQGTRLVTWSDSACGTLVARNKGFHRPSSLTSVFMTPTSTTRTLGPQLRRHLATGGSANSLTAQLAASPRAGTGQKLRGDGTLRSYDGVAMRLTGTYRVSDSVFRLLLRRPASPD